MIGISCSRRTKLRTHDRNYATRLFDCPKMERAWLYLDSRKFFGMLFLGSARIGSFEKWGNQFPSLISQIALIHLHLTYRIVVHNGATLPFCQKLKPFL